MSLYIRRDETSALFHAIRGCDPKLTFPWKIHCNNNVRNHEHLHRQDKTRYNKFQNKIQQPQTLFQWQDTLTCRGSCKHIWELIDCNTSYNLKWHIKRTNAYRGNTSRCNFCLSEKLGTLFNYDAFLLNKRSELFTKINVAMKLNSSLPITQSAIPTVKTAQF